MLTVQPNMLDYILTAANTLVVVPVLDQALLKGLEKLDNLSSALKSIVLEC